jgi:peptide-methionine (S)-S-oxide reductase
MTEGLEKATFGAGCFWCVEAAFQRIKGVKSVVSGYAGGTVENPTYEEVCSGKTGHIEVVQITFDREVISYEELLDTFWKAHDPTSLNRQGPDVGTQYRSTIFYHNGEQKRIAERSKAEVEKKFDKPIVTEIKPLINFYKAESYHQDYYNRNRNAPYCRFVIHPKLKKLKLE